MRRSLVPQLITVTYEKLSKSVGKVECYIAESANHERQLWTANFEKLEDEDEDELAEVKFFIEMVFAVHHHGLGEYDHSISDTEVIEIEQFLEFITQHLNIVVPGSLNYIDALQRFVKKKIIGLRRPKKNDVRPADKLVTSDLNSLLSTYIRQYMSFKEALI